MTIQINNNYAQNETKVMHHILSEKMKVKCRFILPSPPIVSSILSQAYKVEN